MKTTLIAVSASILLAAPAFAHDEPAADAPVGWTGEGSVSAGTTTGNTETTDLGIGINASRDFGVWTTGIEAVADYAELDGVESKNRWLLAGQLDRQINDRLYGFGRVSYEQDEFSGFDSRTFVGGGLGYQVIASERTSWTLEGGPGFKIDEVAEILPTPENGLTMAIPATTEESVSAIAKSDFGFAFNEAVSFSNITTVLYAQESTQVGNTAAITAALTDRFSARFSVDVRHDTNPPMGFEDTDTATRFSLVYSIG